VGPLGPGSKMKAARTAAAAMTRQMPDPATALASGRRRAAAGGRAAPAGTAGGMSAVSGAKSA
jgi:hypothetical protein